MIPWSKRTHWFFVDIDLTLADTRDLVLSGGPEPIVPGSKEHDAWVAKVTAPEELKKAKAITGMLKIVKAVETDLSCRIVFLTNRREVLRSVTTEWLRRYDLHAPLIMRPDGELKRSGAFKAEVAEVMRALEDTVTFVDDDPDGSLELECRKRGWDHLKPTTYRSTWP
jgi:hypothetical protein